VGGSLLAWLALDESVQFGVVFEIISLSVLYVRVRGQHIGCGENQDNGLDFGGLVRICESQSHNGSDFDTATAELDGVDDFFHIDGLPVLDFHHIDVTITGYCRRTCHEH